MGCPAVDPRVAMGPRGNNHILVLQHETFPTKLRWGLARSCSSNAKRTKKYLPTKKGVNPKLKTTPESYIANSAHSVFHVLLAHKRNKAASDFPESRGKFAINNPDQTHPKSESNHSHAKGFSKDGCLELAQCQGSQYALGQDGLNSQTTPLGYHRR